MWCINLWTNTVCGKLANHSMDVTSDCGKTKRNRTVRHLITDEKENTLLIWIKWSGTSRNARVS